MKLTLLTLLALLVAGVINLQAQTEPTTAEQAWITILNTNADDPAKTPEALALRDQILAGETLTVRELYVVRRVTKVNSGPAEVEVMVRSIASGQKTGEGVTKARALVKSFDRNLTGWTQEMVTLELTSAARLSLGDKLQTAELASMVWSAMQARSAHTPALRYFFKAYRNSLPKAGQISATQRQKDLLLAIPQRDDLSNSWLAEMSADLIALQLDQ